MKFDWCVHGRCEECIRSYERFYIGPVGKGRKKKDGIIMTGEVITCNCDCHKE